MNKGNIKIVTKGVEEHGDIPGESWYGWQVINIPSEWFEREEWEFELGDLLGISVWSGAPGQTFRDAPLFSVDTYQRYHKDRTNVLITQHGGLDI